MASSIDPIFAKLVKVSPDLVAELIKLINLSPTLQRQLSTMQVDQYPAFEFGAAGGGTYYDPVSGKVIIEQLISVNGTLVVFQAQSIVGDLSHEIGHAFDVDYLKAYRPFSSAADRIAIGLLGEGKAAMNNVIVSQEISAASRVQGTEINISIAISGSTPDGKQILDVLKNGNIPYADKISVAAAAYAVSNTSITKANYIKLYSDGAHDATGKTVEVTTDGNGKPTVKIIGPTGVEAEFTSSIQIHSTDPQASAKGDRSSSISPATLSYSTAVFVSSDAGADLRLDNGLVVIGDRASVNAIGMANRFYEGTGDSLSALGNQNFIHAVAGGSTSIIGDGNLVVAIGGTIAFNGINQIAEITGTTVWEGVNTSLIVKGAGNVVHAGPTNVTSFAGDWNVLNAEGGTAAFTGLNQTANITGTTVWEGANTNLFVQGAGNVVNAGATNVTSFAGDWNVLNADGGTAAFTGFNQTANITGTTIWEAANTSLAVYGAGNVVNAGATNVTSFVGDWNVLNADGGTAAFTGFNQTANITGTTVWEGANTGLAVHGSGNTVNAGGSDVTSLVGDRNVLNATGGVAAFTGSGQTANITGTTVWEGANTSLNAYGTGNVINAVSTDVTGIFGNNNTLNATGGTAFFAGKGEVATIKGTALSVGLDTKIIVNGLSDPFTPPPGSSVTTTSAKGVIDTRTTSRSGSVSYYDDLTFLNGDYSRVSTFADGSHVTEMWNRSGSDGSWNKADLHFESDGALIYAKQIYADGSFTEIAYGRQVNTLYDKGNTYNFFNVSLSVDRNGALLGSTYYLIDGTTRLEPGTEGGLISGFQSYAGTSIDAQSNEDRGRQTLLGDDQIGAWYQAPTAGLGVKTSGGNSGSPTSPGNFGFNITDSTSLYLSGYSYNGGFGGGGGFRISF